MKKIYFLVFFIAVFVGHSANASFDSKKFQNEILDGLDLITAEETVQYTQDFAPGELGREVYEFKDSVNQTNIRLFVPTTHYLRMGGGINLGFASSKMKRNNDKIESKNGYSTQIGLGWNLSSYIRTEIDLQFSDFKFKGLDNIQATHHMLGGILYFDFARRYVQMGDITKRRTFIPFMGVGVGFGAYDYQGQNGTDGVMITAPRVSAGFNLMLSDLIGIDIMYQYHMLIGNEFGWGTNTTKINSISNIMASVRMNF